MTSMPKVLLFDIETAPILGAVWGLWNNNIALNQIRHDWHVISWSAKWLDDKPSQIMYQDQRSAKNVEDDSLILKSLWKLLDDADVVITHNGKNFDAKKVNARFIYHGMKPPSSYKHIDTCAIAKKKFGFTSNKLAYLSSILNTKYKKQEHRQYPGFELWRACVFENDIKAWKEMQKYNMYDVLALEELYKKLAPWDKSVNFSIFHLDGKCDCGSKELKKNGVYYTNIGKYQRYRCISCGAEYKDRVNLLTKEEKTKILR